MTNSSFKSLHVWIVTIGEQIPEVDGMGIRPWRTSLLTHELLNAGHKVIRWTSTFDHQTKRLRTSKPRKVMVDENYQINFIKAIGYKKNISFRRLIDHWILSIRFSFEAKASSKPDIIFCSMPTIGLAYEAVKIARKFEIPIVVDVRDMWPDIFFDHYTGIFKRLTKTFLYLLTSRVSYIARNADGVIGISRPYVNWFSKYGNRENGEWEKVFPMAYPSKSPSLNVIKEADDYWRNMGITSRDFNICLFATLENSFDIEVLFEASKRINEKYPDVKFIICGNGSKLDGYIKVNHNNNNIIFPGWVDYGKIWQLMRLSKLGILPYKNLRNFRDNITNKPIEYLSAGLPLASSIDGVLGELINELNCGFIYNNDVVLLSEKIIWLRENKDVLDCLSRNALKAYDSKFKAEVVYAELSDYISKIYNYFHETN